MDNRKNAIRNMGPSKRLLEIMRSCPNAILGYNPNYLEIYKKNPKDFAKIIKEKQYYYDLIKTL